MIALEHALILLLLLMGLLTAHPKLPSLARWGVIGGIFLAFVAPTRANNAFLELAVCPGHPAAMADCSPAGWPATAGQPAGEQSAIWIFLEIGITTVISQTANLEL